MKFIRLMKFRFVGILCLIIFLLIPSIKVEACPPTNNDDTWTLITYMDTARSELAAVEVNEKIYAIGGYNGTHWLSIVEEFDPITDTWRTRAPMPTARSLFVAVEVNGKIYALGGWNNSGSLATVEVYDPTNNTWERRQPMAQKRQEFAAVAIDERIYIFGGINKDGLLPSVLQYNPNEDSWHYLSPIPTPRSALAAAEVNGTIYVFGGRDENDQLSIVEAYDPVTNMWDVNRAQMSDSRERFAGVSVGGRLYAIGGRGFLPVLLDFPSDEYNPVINTWQSRTRIPKDSGPEYIAAVEVKGKIYAFGGQTFFPVSSTTAQVWMYDPPFYDTDGDGLADDEELGRFGTDPFVIDTDTDNDGLPDAWENANDLNPLINDIDDDDLLDGAEVLLIGTNPKIFDSDGDGLTDGFEVDKGLDPCSDDRQIDSDGDGLTNTDEIFIYNTNPKDADTDNDSLKDGDEIYRYETDPLKPDADLDKDNDRLTNVEEVDTYKTRLDNPDTDNDELEDGVEVNTYGSDPNNLDSDNDDLLDGEEVFNYGTNVTDADTDGDDLSDGDEVSKYLTNPLVPDANLDTDGDGLTNVEEVDLYGTNVTMRDTDDDDLEDGMEITRGTLPLNADTDGDGRTDGWEVDAGTNPHSPDSDNDWFPDGSDPLPTINNFLIILPSIGIVVGFLSIRWLQNKRRLQQFIETPILLLVLTEGGLSIFTKKFEAGRQLDDQLIGGLITAINSFGQDVFEGSATDQIVYQEYTVVLTVYENMMFCYIFKGASQFAREKLALFVESIQTSDEIWEILDSARKRGVFLKTSEQARLDRIITDVFQL